MFLIIKPYLHLNCVLRLNWIVWNWTVFDIETVLTLNWIVIYNSVNKLDCLKCFWQLNCVLMLNWIVLNRTDYLPKNGFGVKWPTCHTKTNLSTNQLKTTDCFIFKIFKWRRSSLLVISLMSGSWWWIKYPIQAVFKIGSLACISWKEWRFQGTFNKLNIFGWA